MNRELMRKLEKMQNEMIEMQKEIKETLFTNTAGGIVTVTMGGDKKIKEIKIQEGFMPENQEDLDLLCDSIIAACNQSHRDIEKITAEKMGMYQPVLNAMGGLF